MLIYDILKNKLVIYFLFLKLKYFMIFINLKINWILSYFTQLCKTINLEGKVFTEMSNKLTKF